VEEVHGPWLYGFEMSLYITHTFFFLTNLVMPSSFDILMLTISFTHHQSDTSNAFKKENYLFDCLT